jgi:O-methyltransferase
MFNLNKVTKARKRLALITGLLFKLFQLNLRYKENRKDYGIEIFEYFYLPWKTESNFNQYYKTIFDYTLNPKSRLYTIYDLSLRYLEENSIFVEVGTWRGGVCGLISLAHSEKKLKIYCCDTFTGVKNSSDKDSFFTDNEYSDASINDIKDLEKKVNYKFEIVKGVFPDSFDKIFLESPISMAHIDVDTYLSAKESFHFIFNNLKDGGLIILDDYGGWFTDGVTKFGEELKNRSDMFVVSNHIGQLIIFKK